MKKLRVVAVGFCLMLSTSVQAVESNGIEVWRAEGENASFDNAELAIWGGLGVGVDSIKGLDDVFWIPIRNPYPMDPTRYTLVSDRIDLEEKYSYWTRVVPRGFSEKVIWSSTSTGTLGVCVSAPLESLEGSADDVVFITLRF